MYTSVHRLFRHGSELSNTTNQNILYVHQYTSFQMFGTASFTCTIVKHFHLLRAAMFDIRSILHCSSYHHQALLYILHIYTYLLDLSYRRLAAYLCHS